MTKGLKKGKGGKPCFYIPPGCKNLWGTQRKKGGVFSPEKLRGVSTIKVLAKK